MEGILCFTTLHNFKLYTEAPSKAMTLKRHPTWLHLSQEQLGFAAAQPAQSAPPDAGSRSSEIPLHIPASGGAGAIRQRWRLI